MTRRTRRTRGQIFSSIIKSILENGGALSISRISVEIGMSYDRVKRYCTIAEATELIAQSSTSTRYTGYTVTPKGSQYLKIYEDLEKMLI